MAVTMTCAVLFIFISFITISSSLPSQRNTEDLSLRNSQVLKMFREMGPQIQMDLDLPANASSIRKNITNNFSCVNRTYGYYADVENECQVFHVCLTARSTSGRNNTYRWSFICPNETIFNQEVLTCTRPRDSINCADSPSYYGRNDEIGKVNDTKTEGSSNNSTNINKSNKPTNTRQQHNNKKQNLIMEKATNANKVMDIAKSKDEMETMIYKEIEKMMVKQQEILYDNKQPEQYEESQVSDNKLNEMEINTTIVKENIETSTSNDKAEVIDMNLSDGTDTDMGYDGMNIDVDELTTNDEVENIAESRSTGSERKRKRGAFRFSADSKRTGKKYHI